MMVRPTMPARDGRSWMRDAVYRPVEQKVVLQASEYLPQPEAFRSPFVAVQTRSGHDRRIPVNKKLSPQPLGEPEDSGISAKGLSAGIGQALLAIDSHHLRNNTEL
jgi:hypothetical protein